MRGEGAPDGVSPGHHRRPGRPGAVGPVPGWWHCPRTRCNVRGCGWSLVGEGWGARSSTPAPPISGLGRGRDFTGRKQATSKDVPEPQEEPGSAPAELSRTDLGPLLLAVSVSHARGGPTAGPCDSLLAQAADGWLRPTAGTFRKGLCLQKSLVCCRVECAVFLAHVWEGNRMRVPRGECSFHVCTSVFNSLPDAERLAV